MIKSKIEKDLFCSFYFSAVWKEEINIAKKNVNIFLENSWLKATELNRGEKTSIIGVVFTLTGETENLGFSIEGPRHNNLTSTPKFEIDLKHEIMCFANPLISQSNFQGIPTRTLINRRYTYH